MGGGYRRRTPFTWFGLAPVAIRLAWSKSEQRCGAPVAAPLDASGIERAIRTSVSPGLALVAAVDRLGKPAGPIFTLYSQTATAGEKQVALDTLLLWFARPIVPARWRVIGDRAVAELQQSADQHGTTTQGELEIRTCMALIIAAGAIGPLRPVAWLPALRRDVNDILTIDLIDPEWRPAPGLIRDEPPEPAAALNSPGKRRLRSPGVFDIEALGIPTVTNSHREVEARLALGSEIGAVRLAALASFIA